MDSAISIRDAATFVDLLLERSQERPDHRIYSFLDAEGEIVDHWTLARLEQHSKAIAASLQHITARGERAVLLYPPGLEFVAAFLGCLLSGAIATPLQAPAAARFDRAARRIRSVFANAQPRFVLTLSRLKRAADASVHEYPELQQAEWIASDETPSDAAGDWRRPRIAPDDLALLQYTSGSTSQPKGVKVSHSNLVGNEELIRQAFRQDRESRILSWLPHYHDMGLVGGILQPLYLGASCFLMSPVSFLQSPIRWLKAISRHRISTSGGPDFAFDLCTNRIGPEQRADLDLSSWRVAFNGSEPIRCGTLRRFAEAFGPCGFREDAFYPCYGLAESTLFVTGSRGDGPPRYKRVAKRALEENEIRPAQGAKSVRLVSCGRPLQTNTVRIVDPSSGQPCPDGRVGEIWVGGASVAGGYWNHPQESKEAFEALCEGDGPYLRTGDLGFLDGGELFVTGRLKDLIIVRGANHYPQDLERTIQLGHGCLRDGSGAVFTVPGDPGQGLAAVQELTPRHPSPEGLDGVIEGIRDCVFDEHELQLSEILLVKAGSVPKTSSGKVRRQAVREAFLQSGISAIRRWRSAAADESAPGVSGSGRTALGPGESEEIRAVLSQAASRLLGVRRETALEDVSLRSLGIDSLSAAEISHEVERRLGRTVPLHLLFSQLPLSDLAARIASIPHSRPLPRLQPDEDREAFPLSRGQAALWFLQRMSPRSAAYNLFFACRLLDAVEVGRLGTVFQSLVDRHPVLRTTIIDSEQGPQQRVHPRMEVPFSVEEAFDWSGAILEERLQEEAAAPFDLSSQPPLRVCLLKRADHDLLLVTLHHIAADQWSLELLAQEIGQGLGAGDVYASEPRDFAYGRFVRWQQEMLDGAVGAEHQEYWRRRFAGGLAVVELPYDSPRPRRLCDRGAQIDFEIGASLAGRLRELGRTQGTTLFALLLTAFFVLLHRYTGQSKLLVGAPTTGRSRAEFEDIVGYFINPVGLEADLAGDPCFDGLLRKVRETVSEALTHSDYPLADLVQQLQPERDLSRSPLFQAVFSLQRSRGLGSQALAPFALGRPSGPLRLGDLRLETIGTPRRHVPFELSLLLVEGEDSIPAGFQYRSQLFESATIERMARAYLRLLSRILENPGRPVQDLQLLSRTERRQLLQEWSGNSTEPEPASALALFKALASDQDQLPALADGRTSLSYGQLNRRANRLARLLRQRGVGAEDRVALVLPRGLGQAIAALAVSKAGGAYVSLDPTLPAGRLRWMIADSGARLVLTEKGTEFFSESAERRAVEKGTEFFYGASEKGTENLETAAKAAPTGRSVDREQAPEKGTEIFSDRFGKGTESFSKAAERRVVEKGTEFFLRASEKGTENLEAAAKAAPTGRSVGREQVAEKGTEIFWDRSGKGTESFFKAAEKGTELVCTGDGKGTEVFDLQEMAQLAAEEDSGDLGLAEQPEQLAYVIYTSGSTGRPKGVMLTRGGLANLCSWHRRAYAPGTGDRATLLASPGFDASVWELWPYLSAGAELLVVSGENRLSAQALRDFLEEEGVTHCFAPTPLAERLLALHWRESSLRTLLTGGDRLRSHPRSELPFALYNNYGPTESTVVATWTAVETDGEGAPPIGRPTDATRSWILDRNLMPVPIGAPGELCLGGAGLARGYAGRPGETAAAFLPDPYSGEPGSRLYRSSDRARWLPDGRIAYLGRLDAQIKLRGYRIEPGEIEAALRRSEGIEDAAAALRSGRLLAWAACSPESFDEAALKTDLSRRLPEYMVPARIARLDALPLTPNGKLDRAALPEPKREPGSGREPSPAEEILAGIWCELLGTESVGLSENFFELGGHSLLATQLASRVREAFGAEIELRAVFESPTVEGLAARLEGAGRGAEEPIGRVDRRRPLPLSYAQERLWFLDRLAPGGAAYNIPAAIRIEGEADEAALQAALTEVIRRHEILRSRIGEAQGRPHLILQQWPDWGWNRIDLQRLPEERRQAEASRLAGQEAERPFDLGAGPLIRVSMARLSPHQRLLLVTLHHVVSDGWSMGLLVSEASRLYDAYRQGRPSPLAELPIQYADWAAWQRKRLAQGAEAEQLAYWRRKLEGLEGHLELPLDHPRPPVQSFAGAAAGLRIEAELSRRLERLARRSGATLFMLLLAAFKVLLRSTAGREDLAVGTPVAGRTRRSVEGLIGLFVNTLVVRTQASGNLSFEECLKRVREASLEAWANQDLPFERVVEELRPQRNLSHSPLFQVMFSLQNPPAAAEQAQPGGLRFSRQASESRVAKFDQSWSAAPDPDGLRIAVEYNRSLYARPSVERLTRRFALALERIASDPQAPIAGLDLLSQSERLRLLQDWGRGRRAVETPSPLALFETLAAQRGSLPAVEDERESVDYGQLNRRANRLARLLRAQGLGTEGRLALVLPRGVPQALAALAALKAGAAYVSLEPSLPATRLATMIADSGALLALSQKGTEFFSSAAEKGTEFFSGAAAAEIEVRDPADLEREAAGLDSTDLGLPEHPRQAAYLIYTSGSTGRPKGVLVSRGALANLCSWHRRAFAPGPGVRATLLASPGFDASVWELWPHLSAGSCLKTVPEPARLSPQGLQQFLLDEGISCCFAPTPLAEGLLGLDWPRSKLRLLLAGGDRLRLRPRADLPFALHNAYGPTECAVVASCSPVAPQGQWPPAIGQPLDGISARVLDPELRLAPQGTAGQLWLSGAGLARGYDRRPAETADAFRPDPFSDRPGGRMYRSGDLTLWRDGELECLGRADRQLKLRGYRIEPGEIESLLRRGRGIEDAAVALRGGRLLAWAVCSPGSFDESALKQDLAQRLPEYMVPGRIVRLDSLPLSAGGKPDREALPEPEREGRSQREPTPAEEILKGIWVELLSVDSVGLSENFFELGGHSLLATQLVSRIRQAFGAEMELRAVFESPTVEGLATRIGQAKGKDTSPSDQSLTPIALDRRPSERAPLSFAQERLWFLEHLQPGSPIYHMAGAVRLSGQLDRHALGESLNDLIERHEILRTTFRTESGQPYQRIDDAWKVDLNPIDLSGLDDQTRTDRLTQRIRREVERPFDLSRGPLLRPVLFRLSRDEHLLLFIMHHIVSDGWSVAVLIREVAAFYAARIRRVEPALAPLAIQYSDFARWQRDWLQGEVLQAQLNYWKERLAEPIPTLQLRTDRPRPPVQTFAGSRLPLRVGRPLSERVSQLSRRENATLFMTLLAAFKALLCRATGQEDLIVGSLIANRNRVETEGLIGFFVNPVALRSDLSGDPSFRQLLERVREVTLGAYAHQDLPFEKLVEALQPERDLSRAPYFQVMLVLQNTPDQEIRLPNLVVETERVETDTAAFDLTVTLSQQEDGIAGSMEFNSDLFDSDSIDRLSRQFVVLLDAATADPDQKLLQLPLLSPDEQRRIAVRWNRTEKSYPLHRCFHQLFEEQAMRTPQRTAVSYRDERLSYAELNARSNRLARNLLGNGVEFEEPVALLGRRNPDFLVALLGILKCGAVYLPLDPLHPAARLTQVLEQSGARFAAASADHAQDLQQALEAMPPNRRPRLLALDDLIEKEQAEGDLGLPIQPLSLAYVLFTSGSTGQPKGAMVHQAGMLNHLFAKISDLEMNGDDIVAQTASQCFDISIWQFLSPLLLGGCCEIFDEDAARVPSEMLSATESKGVTVLEVVPSLLRELIEEIRAAESPPDLSRLRWMIATGEALPPDSVRAWLSLYPGIPMMNAYGPTECSDDVTHHILSIAPPQGEASVPIGKALSNTRLYIVDPSLTPVPIGIAGELCVGGAGVGRGYLDSPRRTAPIFLPDPFSESPGDRIYKTGDLSRYLPDGTIEFLGRIDHQVKIRGFRIELGEIENVMLTHPAVQQAVVATSPTRNGSDQLVAYVVPKTSPEDGHSAKDAELSTFTRDQVEHWQLIFGGIYRAEEPSDPTLNLSGWTSSYTGQPIPEAEMKEWVESTVENVLAFQPSKVLEIGCGTGMLLLRIAHHCREYWGADLTPESIETLRTQIAQEQGLEHVRLLQRPADDFEGIPEDSFDAVILNSVVQYFPSIDYLVKVIEGALPRLRQGGILYLGDIRSLPLLQALHFSLAHFRSKPSASRRELEQEVRLAIDQEQELVVDPAFFHALRRRYPAIGEVDIRPKRGRSLNELTKFRYDVVMRVGGGNGESEAPQGLDWNRDGLALPSVTELLRGRRPTPLVIQGVPNARLQLEEAGLKWLKSGEEDATRAQLDEALKNELGAAVDPEDWRPVADRFGYALNLRVGASGDPFRYDVLLTDPKSAPARIACAFDSACRLEPRPWREYANNPLHESRASRLIAELRTFLRDKLPDYMVPSGFVPLQAIPLTANGKADRRALPRPEYDRSGSESPYLAPQGTTEESIAEVWRQVLGIDQVGARDRFFDVGGDSLKIVKTYRMLADLYPQVLSVVDLFKYNTIQELARHIDQLAEPSAAAAQVIEAFEV